MFIISFLLSIGIGAETPPIVLEKGQEHYLIGLNIDILEDKTGNLKISDVTGPKWSKKFKKNSSLHPNFGVSKSSFWARFKVKNLDPSKKWILSYNFVSQDNIEFFKKEKNEWRKSLGGDNINLSEREFKMRGIYFEIIPDNKIETLYFIKAKGFATQMPLTISSSKELIKQNIKNNLVLGMFFGFAFLMLIHNLFNYLRLKETTYIFYVFHVGFYLLFVSIGYGYGHLFMVSDLPWLNNEGHLIFTCLSILFLNIFAAKFLKIKEKNHVLFKITVFWTFIWLVLALLPLFTFPFALRKVVGLVYIIFVPGLLFMAAYKINKNDLPAIFFLIAIFSKISGNIAAFLTLNGVIPINFFTSHSTIIGSLFEMLFLSFGLSIVKELEHLLYLKSEREMTLLNKNLIIERKQLKDLNKELSDIKEGLCKTVNEKTSQLKLANIELVKSNNALIKSNEALEKIQRERSFFFSNLSHELRTPLNAILGFSKILQEIMEFEEWDQRERLFVDAINVSGKSLLRLVNTIYDFTKIELNEFRVVTIKVNLKEFLNSISVQFKNECKGRSLNFLMEVDDDLPHWIETDEVMLKRAIDNILNNATKFTKRGHIKLKVYGIKIEKKPIVFNLIISIEDTGRGIENDKLLRIFDAFSEVHEKGSIPEKGSGLGLYIANKIIQDLNGTLGVSSVLGKGSVFTIELKDLKFSKQKILRKDYLYSFLGGTVLICEDNHLSLELYKAYLATHNLNVEVAHSGKELLEKVKVIKPDVVLASEGLSELSAEEALKELRKENINIPSIFISTQKIEKPQEVGFSSSLHKPVDRDSLLKELSNYLEHTVEMFGPNEVSEMDDYVSLDFTIPQSLNDYQIEFISKLNGIFIRWEELMELTEIEKGCKNLKLECKSINLKSLIPFFEKLEESAESIQLNVVEKLLKMAIKKTKRQ